MPDPSDCDEDTPSPMLPADLAWRGVRLSAPSTVASRGPIPICVAFRVEIPTEVGRPARVIAVDVATGERFEAPLVEPRPDQEIPMPEWLRPTSRRSHRVSAEGTDRHDLLRYLALPSRAAEYDVHVVLNGLASNVVRVRVLAP